MFVISDAKLHIYQTATKCSEKIITNGSITNYEWAQSFLITNWSITNYELAQSFLITNERITNYE